MKEPFRSAQMLVASFVAIMSGSCMMIVRIKRTYAKKRNEAVATG